MVNTVPPELMPVISEVETPHHELTRAKDTPSKERMENWRVMSCV